MKRNGFPGLLLLSIALVGMGLGACKTTVKNYQEAYDIAQHKREQDEKRRQQLQEEMGVDRTKLEDVDEMPINRIEVKNPDASETLQLHAVSTNFHRADSVRGIVVSVAKFKMPANAVSLASDLKAEGFEKARSVRSGEETYVLIDEATYPYELAPTIFRFRKKLPAFPYVGQNGEMLLIYAR